MVNLLCLVLVHLVQETLLWSFERMNTCGDFVLKTKGQTRTLSLIFFLNVCLHACAAGPVDDDGPARVVDVVLHAKVGRHPMDQHAVVG